METESGIFINNIGLAVTILMCVLMLILPRRYALLPVLVLTCYMSMGQRVVVGGLHFTTIRILVIFGWLRVLIRRETGDIRLTRIDKALIWWTVSGSCLYVLLWQTSEAVINRLGHGYDALGLFFLFRFLIRSREDVNQMARMFALCMAPLAVLILGEKVSGRNPFAIFGGVSDVSVVRNGVVRCQGPFAHPILAGTFAATNMPFFVALWWKDRFDKMLAVLGIVSCVVITAASGSSGPVMAFGWAVLGFFLWPMRRHMRELRWGLALGLIALHLVMKAPVWFLIGRLSVFDGSTGFFRAYLIDSTIRNFGDWWLLGTESTAKWGRGLFDVTNEYISQGVSGGILTMALFILIISRSFGTVGKTVRALKDKPMSVKFGVWALGCALMAHVATYFSVSYFDQNIVTWFLLLAAISVGPASSRDKRSKSVVREAAIPEPTPREEVQTETDISLPERGDWSYAE
jgi:hypothetical protein